MPKQDKNATFRKKMQQTVTFVLISCLFYQIMSSLVTLLNYVVGYT